MTARSCLSRRLAFVLTALLALQGCADESGTPSLTLTRTDFASIDGWNSDTLQGVLSPLLTECVRLGRLPVDTKLGGQAEAASQAGLAGQYAGVCRAAATLRSSDTATVRRYFETWFLPYTVTDRGAADARLTGYYEPEFPGALSRSPAYPVPLYTRPTELVTVPGATGGPPVTGQVRAGQVVPYYTRAQIDQGILAGRNLELLWLRSPIDLFFLQVQGSGRVRLPSGQIVRVGYSGRNGQPYVPLGRVLVDRQQLASDQVSMQSIRDWLASHPSDAQATMEQNPNYVFFRELDDVAPNQGPPGALGVPLTPLRSAAIDRTYLPLGVPVFVSTTQPDGQPLDRLMLAQDLGTDITGPARADLFFGWGPQAGRTAGTMHATGRMVVLIPRQPASQPATQPALR